MAQRSHADDTLRTVLAAVETHGGVSQAAMATGVTYATFQSRYRAAIARFGKPKAKESAAPALTDSFSVNGDSAELAKGTHEDVRSLDDLIRVCSIDTSEWHVDRFVCNKWAMGAKNDAGNLVSLPLYQVKAWLRRKRHVIDARAEIASLLADAKQAAPVRPRIVKPSAGKSGLMFEPHIPDLHIGKLAWADETGEANYDAKIAVQVFQNAVEALLHRVSGHRLDEIVFPVGNDLLHSDTKAGTTTGGTPLDTDSRYQKNFMEARKAITWAIEAFRSVAPSVKVVLVPGNHDTLSTWHLGDSLECYYHKTKGVEIDNAPRMRKYLQHGNVMLLFAHGNRGKLEKYPELMAAEMPEMWGATRYREAHTGDKHHRRVIEMQGCTVRISPALCPPDAWHAEMLFTGMLRAAEGFLWHERDGRLLTADYTVPRESVA